MHKVIDLFAGAGGLSLGFKKTGKYEIAAAFEINQNAQKTYKKNHPGTEVFSDVCSADFKKLRRKLGKIDVVIGGPPITTSIFPSFFLSFAKSAEHTSEYTAVPA